MKDKESHFLTIMPLELRIVFLPKLNQALPIHTINMTRPRCKVQDDPATVRILLSLPIHPHSTV